MMGVLAEPFVALFLDPAWAQVATLLVIFAPLGLFQALTNPTGLIYQARGRTDLMLAWAVGSSAVMIAAFALGLPWGVMGVAAAYSLSMIPLAYPVFAIPFRLIGLQLPALLRAIGPGLACAAATLVALLALRVAVGGLPPALFLALALPAGAGVYLALSWRLNRRPLSECLRLAGLPAPGGEIDPAAGSSIV
jgi:PST family polysaccharide transporter